MLCLRAIPQVTNCHLVIRTIACAEKQNQCLIICNRGIVHRSHLQRVLCFPPVFFCYAFASQFGSPHPDNALFLIPSRRTSGPHGLHHITGYSSFDISIKAYHSLFERCTHRSSDTYLQLSVSLSLSLSLYFFSSLFFSLFLCLLSVLSFFHTGAPSVRVMMMLLCFCFLSSFPALICFPMRLSLTLNCLGLYSILSRHVMLCFPCNVIMLHHDIPKWS